MAPGPASIDADFAAQMRSVDDVLEPLLAARRPDRGDLARGDLRLERSSSAQVPSRIAGPARPPQPA